MKATFTASYADNGYVLALSTGKVLGLVMDDASSAYKALRGAWGDAVEPTSTTVELASGGAIVRSPLTKIVADDTSKAFAALKGCVEACAKDTTASPQATEEGKPEVVAVEVLDGTAEGDIAERDAGTAENSGGNGDTGQVENLVSEGTLRDIHACVETVRQDPAAMEIVETALKWGRFLSAAPRGKG